MELEDAKKDRKEITANTVNNGPEIQTNINNINHISSDYLEDAIIIDSTCEFLKNSDIDDICNEFAFRVFKKYTHVGDISTDILKVVFNNNDIKMYRNIFYFKNNNSYYGIIKNAENTEKIVERIDYDTFVFPIVKLVLLMLLNKVISRNLVTGRSEVALTNITNQIAVLRRVNKLNEDQTEYNNLNARANVVFDEEHTMKDSDNYGL